MDHPPHTVMLPLRTGKFTRFEAAAYLLQPKSVVDSEIAAGHLVVAEDGYIANVGGQGETAILAAAGALTTGNINVTITAAGLTGSPVTIVVGVLSTDTLAQAAEKIRVALRADVDVNGFFFIGGTDVQISLVKKTVAAADATLNIALANGTPTATITNAATSVDSQSSLDVWLAGARATANAGTAYSNITAFSAVAANRP